MAAAGLGFAHNSRFAVAHLGSGPASRDLQSFANIAPSFESKPKDTQVSFFPQQKIAAHFFAAGLGFEPR